MNPFAPNEGWEIRFYNDSSGNSNAISVILLNSVQSLNYLSCSAVRGGLSTNTWFHVAITYSGNSSESGLNIFYSGQMVDKTVEINSLSSSILNNIPLRIGQRANSSNIFPLNGRLDDIRIYSRALSGDEIAQMFNATRGRFGV